MDLSALASSLQTTLGAQLPGILGALGILIVGWLIAVVVRAAMRRVLGLPKVNTRIAESTAQTVNVEAGIAAGVCASAGPATPVNAAANAIDRA